ncbi:MULTISPECIES: cell division protein FtsQ/DivIB [unclassified Novosphingobium]|jgi:cell division protein FtsQ|uniref:cell division protein FtsQ/DivIB n=1 Tax=unclassified Novosphingobium TaxID=2644732 RepID=UPI00061C34A9|nr:MULTISPECIES: FtsQ-type POTRA domain-containing protein [unclassified Novosphingobium]RQW44235.1 FtsQ-type POTRA domain-containing protein [Novosphingobium sp. LASN5T]GAO56977.1 cell division protein ftsQ [Novosphingobium sp. MD-1]
MAQTIRRSGKGVRRAAAAKGAQRKVATAKKQTGNVIDGVMQWLPFSEETLHRIVLAVILGVAAMLVWVVASMAGVPMLAQEKLAQVASGAGFEVKRVEVRGVNRMNELKIYEKVLGQRDQSMPRLDIDGLRGDLMQLSWVKDARVSRQLPDTLVVDIVERSPHAVLRKGGKLVLIDDTGHELEPVSAARAKGMLVLEGEGAGEKVQDLGRLLDVAPALKPQVAEAEWIGNRRWNIMFKTGQVLALPEGDDQSASALLGFARMDGVNRLLGGKVASFDMRASDRMYLRVPGHADEVAADQRAAAEAKAAAKKAAQLARAKAAEKDQ